MAFDHIQETINEYQRSCDKLEERILQLDREVARADNPNDANRLSRRRLYLCYELWDMLHAAAELKEYLEAVEARHKAPVPARPTALK